LKRATASEPLDVLVIGGGATGTGTALDATTRYIIVIYMYSRALGYT
jgi:glycerol-3-phosphate dehydrogenase